MKVEWKLQYEKDKKEEVKKALDDYLMEFNKTMSELIGKKAGIPGMIEIPVPVFTMNYVERENDFLIKMDLPFPENRFLRAIFFPNLRKGKKMIEKYFESRKLKVSVK